MGYDSVLFESGDIPFRHDQPIDESCYSEINNCHMLVLIIGGRYGTKTSESTKLNTKELEKLYDQYNSITRKEYQTARDRDIPIFIFVDSNVLAEYQTYKVNRDNQDIKYANVDSRNVFSLLDEIVSQKRNNFVREFENFEDIARWLRDQWAGIFADFLSRDSQESSLRALTSQIADLSGISTALKEYTESILRFVVPDKSGTIISRQEKILTNTRLRRFSEEPMINFLITEGQPKPTSQGLLNVLHESATVEDFLKNSKFDEKFIMELMSKHESKARRDFNELRKSYVVSEEVNEEGKTKASSKRSKSRG
jgi:hypothetical protein